MGIAGGGVQHVWRVLYLGLCIFLTNCCSVELIRLLEASLFVGSTLIAIQMKAPTLSVEEALGLMATECQRGKFAAVWSAFPR